MDWCPGFEHRPWVGVTRRCTAVPMRLLPWQFCEYVSARARFGRIHTALTSKLLTGIIETSSQKEYKLLFVIIVLKCARMCEMSSGKPLSELFGQLPRHTAQHKSSHFIIINCTNAHARNDTQKGAWGALQAVREAARNPDKSAPPILIRRS